MNSSINFSHFGKLKEPSSEFFKTDPEVLKQKSILSSSPKGEKSPEEQSIEEEDRKRVEGEEGEGEGEDDLVCEPSFDDRGEKEEEKRDKNVRIDNFYCKV